MTFSEREKFIYHAATLMTMKIMSKEFDLMPINIQKLMALIRNNRCRQLKDKQIDEIYTDVEEEVLLANSVYDLRDNGVFTR